MRQVTRLTRIATYKILKSFIFDSTVVGTAVKLFPSKFLEEKKRKDFLKVITRRENDENLF